MMVDTVRKINDSCSHIGMNSKYPFTLHLVRSRSPTTPIKEAGSSSGGSDTGFIGYTGTSGVTIGVIGADDGSKSTPETKPKKRGRYRNKADLSYNISTARGQHHSHFFLARRDFFQPDIFLSDTVPA